MQPKRLALLTCLAVCCALFVPAPPAAAGGAGAGPRCDIQVRSGPTADGVTKFCFRFTNGTVRLLCVPLMGGMTPQQVACAINNQANAPGSGLMSTKMNDIVCIQSADPHKRVHRWTTRQRARGSRYRNVGPGPTNPMMPADPPPPSPPNVRRLPVRVMLAGVPVSPAMIEVSGIGRTPGSICSVVVPIPAGTDPATAAMALEMALLMAGCGATFLGMIESPFGDGPIATVELLTEPGGELMEKLLEFDYSEPALASTLGIDTEFGEDDCADGTVNAGVGPVQGVLTVNGFSDFVDVTTGSSITVSMAAPSAGPPNPMYGLWLWRQLPTGQFDVMASGETLGCTVNPTPLHRPTAPQPFRCLRGGVPAAICTGVTEIPAPPAAPWSRTRPQGFGVPATFMLQGVIRDNGAANAIRASVTNAVRLRIL
jgi:hypothetical protein